MEDSVEKPEKSFSPGVAIDGARVRAIREEKKLTQLYVASVVGVTTDTISRWENNRYPTVRRDNAEKLAGALEVELPEILTNWARTAPVQEIPSPRGTERNAALLLLAVILVAVAGLLFQPVVSPSCCRAQAPRFARRAEIIPVQIKVSRTTRTAGDLS